MKKYHISPGDKFNRLTCIKFSYIGDHHRSYFLFKCDCDKEKVILGSLVSSGNTKSCGCLSDEIKKNKAKKAQESKQSAKTAIYLGYKRHARARGYQFDLTKEKLIAITQQNCFYCEAKPSNLKVTKNDKIGFRYNGVDRINNKIGYVDGNCVPCCKVCNRAKLDMSFNDFKEWAKAITIKIMAEQWG